MDLRKYYEELRQTEAEIGEPDAVIVSRKTPDGGRAGVMTEVSRETAARMVVEGRARLSTAEETSDFRARAAKARDEMEEAAAAAKVQVAVVSEDDFRGLRSAKRVGKA